MKPDMPITREELYLDKWAGGGGSLPDRPLTRVETYLAKLCGEDVELPATPITREECYLQDIIDTGGGGGGGGGSSSPIVYGFSVDGSQSDPSLAVTYLEDAEGMTPAHMDYATGAFDYGSWRDAFFMPRPCMVLQEGRVDYYLDPADYSKRANGMSSDVANTSYAGNAMMEWGRDGRKIWYKIVPATGGSYSVYISDRQMDPAYRAWSFINNQGEMVDHFYTPIYNGSSVDSVMRSLSGQPVANGLTGTVEIVQCLANNTSGEELWYTETYADRVLIMLLLVLMGKSLNTQSVFGQGLTSGGQGAFNAYTTGALDTAGMFFGYSDEAHPVKVFGMENLWGLQWRRVAGLLLIDGEYKYRMTYGYNDTGSGYVSTGLSVTGTNGTYITAMAPTSDGLLASSLDGTATSYYCDGEWLNASGARYSLFGGASDIGALCGAFACILSNPLSPANWNIGASLSYKPKGGGFP